MIDELGPAATDCPCKREGKGCINYYVQDIRPFYVCRFTDEQAFVPDDGEVGGFDRMYG